MLKRMALILLTLMLALPTVFGANSGPGIIGNATQSASGFTINFLGSQTASTLVSALLALLVFVVVYIALSRASTLSNGAIPIAAIFAAIVFIVISSQPQLGNLLLNSLFLSAIVGTMIVLVFIPTKNGSKFGKLIIAVAVLLGIYLLLSNFPALHQQIDSALHFEVLTLVSILTVLVIATLVLYGMYRLAAKSGALGKLIAILIGLFIISFLFFPGISIFIISLFETLFRLILSPIGLVIIAIIVVAVLWYMHLHKYTTGGYESYYTERDKKADIKTAKMQHKLDLMRQGKSPPSITDKYYGWKGNRSKEKADKLKREWDKKHPQPQSISPLPPPGVKPIPPPDEPKPSSPQSPTEPDKNPLWNEHQHLYKELKIESLEQSQVVRYIAQLNKDIKMYTDSVDARNSELLKAREHLTFVMAHINWTKEQLVTVKDADKEVVKKLARNSKITQKDIDDWQARVNDYFRSLKEEQDKLDKALKELAEKQQKQQELSSSIPQIGNRLNAIRTQLKMKQIMTDPNTGIIIE